MNYPIKLFLCCLFTVSSLVCCSVLSKKETMVERYQRLYEQSNDPVQRQELEAMIHSIPAQ